MDDSKLLQESNLTARQASRAPHRVIHTNFNKRRRLASEGLVSLMGDHMGCELRSTSTKMLSTTLWTPLQCGVFSRGLLVMVVNFLQKDKIMKYLLASSFNPTQLLVSESWLTASSSQALAVSLEGSSSPEVNTSMIIAETKF